LKILKTKEMELALGIAIKNRQSVVTELTKLLSEETLLYIKTKNKQCTIQETKFCNTYRFFGAQFRQIDELIDHLQEGIGITDHYPPISFRSYLSLVHTTQANRKNNGRQGYIKELTEDHEGIIMALREHLKSFSYSFYRAGSNDLLSKSQRIYENIISYLSSQLK